jgi:hypothetical protein
MKSCANPVGRGRFAETAIEQFSVDAADSDDGQLQTYQVDHRM